jgi:polysaccharide biosynthesis/export protein
MWRSRRSMKARVLCQCVAGVCFLLLFIVTVFVKAQEIQPQSPEGESNDQQTQQGTETQAPIKAGAADLGLGPDYVIGPEDMLTLEVMNVPELKETVRVENDGTIPVRLLGHVKAAGLTTSQLRTDLEKEWGESYLEDPKVSVYLVEFHSRPVSVIGAVAKPGLYQLAGPRTLVEVLAMAGGLATKPNPAGRYLYVTRKEGFDDLQLAEGMEQTAPDQIEIDLKQLVQSRDPALNIKMKPFDIVSVSKAGIIYVIGAVKRPGGFVMEDRERVTVLQALSLAEGTGPYAKKSAARIVRQGENGSRQEIHVDLGKVVKGTGADVEMAANDILIVPDSKGKYAGAQALNISLSTVSGLLVYGSIVH